MRKETWTMATKLCDSCKMTSASLFCRADSVYLCIPCDGKVHAANKLASRHERLWMCEVCAQAPATVTSKADAAALCVTCTSKADAAALCVTCDRDIHSANPLVRRHERFPVVSFNDAAAVTAKISGDNDDLDVNVAGIESEEAGSGGCVVAASESEY